MTTFLRRGIAAAGVLSLALIGVACGDDDGDRTVTASDFKYEDLPETVKAGTRLTLENDSKVEAHEIVAFRLPDAEKRPAADLVKLSEAEFGALAGGPPTMVLIRTPGDGEQINAIGDGTLAEKGRYLVACFIPTGADPAAYLAAAQASGDEPPQVAGGPPHFTQGMFGEITVE